MSVYIPLAFLLVFPLVFGCTKKEMATNQPKSIEELRTELQLNPSYANHMNLGMAFGKNSQSHKAIEVYKKATLINPNAPAAHNNLCFEYNNLGNYSLAMLNCKKAISLEPNFQLAKNNLKVAISGIDILKAEIDKLKKSSLEKSATPENEIINLGLKLYNIGEYGEAIATWKRIKKGTQQYAKAQNNISSAYIMKKDFIQAEKALQIALQIEPNNELFKNNKKWLENEKNKSN